MSLIMQEVSTEPLIEIPEPVRDAYKIWRPTPLYRARRLERALDTPAHIYYKYEGVSPAGSHKPNTAVAQAYENAAAGITKLTTETGAGQWGSSMAFACQLFGLECEVWMVGSSYDQKPYRRSMMQTWGATVHRSPSDVTQSGRDQSGHPTGSLGIAISEAVEVAASGPEHQLLAGLRAQPRAPAPDGHRSGGAGADGDGRRVPRHGHRLRGRRLELRRADVSRSCAARSARGSRRAFWPPSRPPARRSPRASTPTTSATPSG